MLRAADSFGWAVDGDEGCADAMFAENTTIATQAVARAHWIAAAPMLHMSLQERVGRARRSGGDSPGGHAAELEDWRNRMLETIAIILIVLWLLGIVSGYTMGNFIYVLLVIAIVLFLVRLVSGRRVV